MTLTVAPRASGHDGGQLALYFLGHARPEVPEVHDHVELVRSRVDGRPRLRRFCVRAAEPKGQAHDATYFTPVPSRRSLAAPAQHDATQAEAKPYPAASSHNRKTSLSVASGLSSVWSMYRANSRACMGVYKRSDDKKVIFNHGRKGRSLDRSRWSGRCTGRPPRYCRGCWRKGPYCTMPRRTAG